MTTRLQAYRKTSQSSKQSKGSTKYAVVWFAMVFALGFTVGHFWVSSSPVIYYGLRVQSVLPPDSMSLISPATGPFRADFCPENNIQKYEPRAGYVMCKLSYVDRGCMDISNKRDGFIWVKNRDDNESTAILTEHDTFKPWPDCHKEELNANAR